METFHNNLSFEQRWKAWFDDPRLYKKKPGSNALVWIALTVLGLALAYLALAPEPVLAAIARLPGEDASDKLEAAGTLLKVLDTGLFKWGARIFAGLCIMSSAWSLKEQRFGIAVICVIGAIVFGTAPKWVKNIFDIGDNQSLFGQVQIAPQPILARTAISNEVALCA